MIRKFVLQSMTFLIILIISLSSVQNPITSGYINELREDAITVMNQKDPLYLEIDEKKDEYEIKAQDAVIDKVWKAIPGYNGIEVDVEASYNNMQQLGEFQEDGLVFNQISPKVTLEDLDPAPIYRGHPDKPMVSMMVNVAWGNEYLPDILKVMKRHQVKATFFLDGSWVKNNPKLAKMIVEEGHEVGNHAYSHPDMKTLSRGRILDEIIKTNEIIQATIDRTPQWFAPPSGSYRQEVLEVAREHDLYTVLWTVDTIDWKKPEPQQMASRVVQKTEPGSLILMHPTESTLHGLESMIEGIKDKGYMLGTVSEVLSETRITTIRQQ
ncbi:MULTISPECIES: polysaccharide deacetylase family protein [Bacillaceae]|uniref:Polysaccharide deacetylase family protein n=1 Tax=Evansella alkalicola TaxID=745819 RepID=A0ABS6JWD0_9BACI|nr:MULTISPECIES: polysaccharide deacetylase family protein [Bacillaceae]MBU9722695.1 polysaccharide deacetylase family protein [Bacillus alkalicola]